MASARGNGLFVVDAMKSWEACLDDKQAIQVTKDKINSRKRQTRDLAR